MTKSNPFEPPEQAFDPYHVWLGVPKREQPPTHYRLLGVSKVETDKLVIEEAVIRQTTYLRTYQTGEHAQCCSRLLEEVAQAGRVLLDPAQRQAYDAQLQKAAQKPPKPSRAKRAQLPPWARLACLTVVALILCSVIVLLVRTENQEVTVSLLKDYAWSRENAHDKGEKYAHQVGRKKANAWSLRDMHGNADEWCSDWINDGYQRKSPWTDPLAPEKVRTG